MAEFSYRLLEVLRRLESLSSAKLSSSDKSRFAAALTDLEDALEEILSTSTH